MTGYIIAQVNLKKKDGFKDYANISHPIKLDQNNSDSRRNF